VPSVSEVTTVWRCRYLIS